MRWRMEYTELFLFVIISVVRHLYLVVGKILNDGGVERHIGTGQDVLAQGEPAEC